MSADDGVAPGTSAPLGATVSARGVNFSVFAKRASRVELLLFDSEQAAAPSCITALDPITHRTYHCRQLRRRPRPS